MSDNYMKEVIAKIRSRIGTSQQTGTDLLMLLKILDSYIGWLKVAQAENADLRVELTTTEKQRDKAINIDEFTRKARLQEMGEFLGKYDIPYDCGWRNKIDMLIKDLRAKLEAANDKVLELDNLVTAKTDEITDLQTKLSEQDELIRHLKGGYDRVMMQRELADLQAENARLRGALERIANREGHILWMRHIAREALSTPPRPVSE